MGIGNPPFGSENQQGFGILGVEAQGNLIQAGGDFFSFFLTMGQEVGGQGIYLLQAGTSRQKDLTIGQAGHGSVSNTSGIHSVDDLILDLFAGGTGEYRMLGSGAELDTGNEIIGAVGESTFHQTFGLHTILNDPVVGQNGIGVYCAGWR